MSEENTATLIKQDINFLEYPLWIQDKKKAEKMESGMVWRMDGGFLYKTTYKPPTKVDQIFLFYLLSKSQEEDWCDELELSRFEMLRACEMGTSKYWYDRLEDSLNRWMEVKVEFSGTFYDGEDYLSVNFRIVDLWALKKDDGKKLKIRFSKEWLSCIKNSNFFKHIKFDDIKALRSPLASRLHELLMKTFRGRDVWEIGAKKLADKIPMKEKYPADIIPKIQTAIKRICEKTDLRVVLEVRKPERGKAILRFRRLSKEEDLLFLDKGLFFKLLEEVREDERDKVEVQALLELWLEKLPFTVLKDKILYANEKAKKNYHGFLLTSLKEDWELEEKAKEGDEKTRTSKRTKGIENKDEKNKDDAKRAKILLARSLFENFAEEKKEEIRKPLREKLLKQGTPQNAIDFALQVAIQEYMIKIYLS